MSGKIKSTEIALLLLPVIFLIGTGVTLRIKNRMPDGLQLDASNIQFQLLPPINSSPWRFGFKILVQCKGHEPQWWKNGSEIRGTWGQNLRFVDQNGKEFPLNSYRGGGLAYYDAASRSRVFDFTAGFPEGYDARKPGYFKGTVVFANQLAPLKPLGIARFSVPVQFPNLLKLTLNEPL